MPGSASAIPRPTLSPGLQSNVKSCAVQTGQHSRRAGIPSADEGDWDMKHVYLLMCTGKVV